MKPGDILYLPRGQYHDALTGDRASLHVTFGVAPATGLGLARPQPDYGLPARQPPAWYSVARKAQVLRRDAGFAVAFDGGEIPMGADRTALLADIGRLERAGILVATEMR